MKLQTRIAFIAADRLAKTMAYKLNGQWFKCWVTYYFTVKQLIVVLKLVYKEKGSTLTL